MVTTSPYFQAEMFGQFGSSVQCLAVSCPFNLCMYYCIQRMHDMLQVLVMACVMFMNSSVLPMYFDGEFSASSVL